MWLRVYNEISRANHSCRANAVVNYDRSRKVGTLRALEPIAHGAEIFVNYLTSFDLGLMKRKDRQDTLKKSYGFTCQCTTCGLTGRARTADDNLRARALERYKSVNKSYKGDAGWRPENNDHVRKLKLTEDLIRLIRDDLHICDDRLAWVYQKLAELQHGLWEFADDYSQNNVKHCDHCANEDEGRDWHLDQALDAYRRMRRVHLHTYGPRHPMIAEDSRLENALLELTSL